MSKSAPGTIADDNAQDAMVTDPIGRGNAEVTPCPSTIKEIVGMGECHHDCQKSSSVNLENLPAGVFVDCPKCLENFNKHTTLLFSLLLKTFKEQDVERARASTNSRRRLREVNVPSPPVQKERSLQSLRAAARPRINGRFVKKSTLVPQTEANLPMVTIVAPVDPPKIPVVDQSLDLKPPTCVEQGSPLDLIHVKAPESPKSPSGTCPSSNDASLQVPCPVASALPSSPTLQGSKKFVLKTEEITLGSKAPIVVQQDPKENDIRSTTTPLIQNREGGNLHPVVSVTYAQDRMVSLAVDTLNQIPGTNGVPPLHTTPMPAEEGSNAALSKGLVIHKYSGNGNFQPASTINHDRATRKRKLSERGKESLESAIDLDGNYMKDAVQSTAVSVHSSAQPSQEVQATNLSHQSNIMQASEKTVDPPAKKRGRPKKMQASDSQQGSKSQGRPRKQPQPKMQAIMPITPSKTSIHSMNTVSTTITSPPLATNPINFYSMPASQSDYDLQIYPDQFVRNHPIVPRPPVTNPKTALSTPEKRPRGRPKKAVIKKHVPATPVAIKPKPVVVNREPNRVEVPSGSNFTSILANPFETKRRGRPPKPRIPLDRASAAPALSLPTLLVREQGTEVVALPAVGPIPTLRASTAPIMTPIVNPAETLGGSVTGVHKGLDIAAPDPQSRRANLSKPHIILKVKSSPESYSKSMVPCSTDGEDTNTDDESSTEQLQTCDSPIHTNEVGLTRVAEPLYGELSAAKMVTDLASPHRIMTQPITSIADVVRDLSTDSASESQTSYSSSSSPSEIDSDGDATFTPRRAWATVNADNMLPTAGASRGDSSAGRGRGRGLGRGWSRDSMLGSGGHGAASRPNIIEKGQQTLGTFFLKPLVVDETIQEGSSSYSFDEGKRGGKKKGSETTSGRPRVISAQDENQDEEMKDS